MKIAATAALDCRLFLIPVSYYNSRCQLLLRRLVRPRLKLERLGFSGALGAGILCLMRPVLVKKRDTSLPWSAFRAMASAGIRFRGLRVFIILRNLLFRLAWYRPASSALGCCSPASDILCPASSAMRSHRRQGAWKPPALLDDRTCLFAEAPHLRSLLNCAETMRKRRPSPGDKETQL